MPGQALLLGKEVSKPQVSSLWGCSSAFPLSGCRVQSPASSLPSQHCQSTAGLHRVQLASAPLHCTASLLYPGPSEGISEPSGQTRELCTPTAVLIPASGPWCFSDACCFWRDLMSNPQEFGVTRTSKALKKWSPGKHELGVIGNGYTNYKLCSMPRLWVCFTCILLRSHICWPQLCSVPLCLSPSPDTVPSEQGWGIICNSSALPRISKPLSSFWWRSEKRHRKSGAKHHPQLFQSRTSLKTPDACYQVPQSFT